MTKFSSVLVEVLLLAAILAACSAAATQVTMTDSERCARSGGLWRGSSCDMSAGGGGGGGGY